MAAVRGPLTSRTISQALDEVTKALYKDPFLANYLYLQQLDKAPLVVAKMLEELE